MLGSWCVKWFKMLSIWCVKRFNWNALRDNRMMLYVAAAVIVILISVPVIVWKMGGAPAKDPGTVPSSTSVAAPEVTRKTRTSMKAQKVETPAAAKKAGPSVQAQKVEIPAAAKKTGPSVKAQKVEIPAVAEKAETTVNVQKAEIPTPVSEDQKKPEITTTIEKPAAPATVSLGIAPWGEVYVDGQKKGVSPPLNRLQMAPGRHTIEIRNTAFPPYKQTVALKPGEQLKIKHKFP
jgi:hypothetical protein